MAKIRVVLPNSRGVKRKWLFFVLFGAFARLMWRFVTQKQWDPWSTYRKRSLVPGLDNSALNVNRYSRATDKYVCSPGPKRYIILLGPAEGKYELWVKHNNYMLLCPAGGQKKNYGANITTHFGHKYVL